MSTTRSPRAARKATIPHDGVAVRGFARFALHNAETGALEYESDWQPNLITDIGMQTLVQILSTTNVTSRPRYMEIATQSTAVASNQDDPLGPFGQRKEVTWSTGSNASANLIMTASWNSTEGTASNLGALAMYTTNTGGSALSLCLLSATVSKSNTQTMNATYTWNFA